VFDSGSSDSTASVIATITYKRGLEMAASFRNDYYPKYAKLYDKISEQQSKGEAVAQTDRDQLWKWHGRLETMKKEISAAAKREHQRVISLSQ